MHTENNDEIIEDNCGTDAPKLCEDWPLTRQWHGGLNSNNSPGQAGFNFIIPFIYSWT